MSDANKALAEVRGWLCDNLGSGDAGKVCGMLSVVSRRINELLDENAKLRELAIAFNWCTENFDMPCKCDGCPLGQSDKLTPECEVRMRELGVLDE